MRKIEKPTDIPTSLNDKTVQKKRNQLIAAGCYIDNDLYNLYYKKDDIKSVLKTIHYHKCAFCESKTESLHVEHFRPKTTYYWLAYSWDNLLLACPHCNSYKSKKFEIEGTPARYDANCLNNIHSLSTEYDKEERPKLVNPEREDILHVLEVDKLGNLSSQDVRVQHTIDICKLNRPYLTDERKQIFDDFERKLDDCCKMYGNNQSFLRQRIIELAKEYKEMASNIASPYYCFRNKLFYSKIRYILQKVLQ